MLTVDYDILRLGPRDVMLDLGCGFGRHAYGAAARGARVIASDLSLDELSDIASTTFAMHQSGELADLGAVGLTAGDACRLPFGDASFTRIVASEVLEHIEDDRLALRELVRVLQPGGMLAVTVPSWFPEKLCWMLDKNYSAPQAEGGHVRIYTRSELTQKLKAAGLIPTARHRAHALHSPYWWLRCGLGEDNRLCKMYHRFLCWDIEHNPISIKLTERLLSPVLGKSLVVYARKPEPEPESEPESN